MSTKGGGGTAKPSSAKKNQISVGGGNNNALYVQKNKNLQKKSDIFVRVSACNLF